MMIKDLWHILKQTFKDFADLKITRMSAALAYYTVFSIAPMLIVIITLCDIFLGREAEDAIESYFDSLHIEKEKGKGFIIKKSLGYMLFKRATVENVNDSYDYYFVVENKKQKGKDASIISIAVGKGTGNFFSSDDKRIWDDVNQFAGYLQANYFEQYKLYTQLASTTKDMEKKKKKLDDLLKEKSELESNISNDSLQIVNFNDSLLKLKTKKQ